jgi:hypothetical protein
MNIKKYYEQYMTMLLKRRMYFNREVGTYNNHRTYLTSIISQHTSPSMTVSSDISLETSMVTLNIPS